jgi:Bcr/CflA subfamily drug resistance transporter
MTTTLSQKRVQWTIWVLLGLFPISGMTIDLVAPSLPAIAASLQISDKIAKDVISIYLLGCAFGNFFTGFLADALGRRNLMRIALLGFVTSSLIPTFFPHIEMLLLARFLQGVTIGAVTVLARAILSDVLPPEKLIRLGTLIAAMWGLGPIIGPVIGGYLQVYFGWKAGFYFFALISFFAVVIVFLVLPETHVNRHPLNIKTIKNNLREVLTHRIFIAVIILMGLDYSIFITFNVLGPFFIQTKLGYSPIFFGRLALCLGIVFLISTFTCRYFLKHFNVEKLFFIIVHAAFFVAVLATIASYYFDQSIFLVVFVSGLMFFASGFIFPMAMGKGLSLFRHIAATATATMSLINILMTSLISFFVSFINIQSAIPMMLIYAVLLLISVIIYWRMLRERE